jgi:putative sterol carrier protein
VDNGATAARAGRGPARDREVRVGYDDWVDIVAGRLDPRRAVATGRLRPRGNPRALWRARGLF